MAERRAEQSDNGFFITGGEGEQAAPGEKSEEVRQPQASLSRPPTGTPERTLSSHPPCDTRDAQVRILEERVASLESQLRTHEKLSETHLETYLAVDRMRDEKVEMDETLRELTQELQRLAMVRNPTSDQATQKPGFDSAPSTRPGSTFTRKSTAAATPADRLEMMEEAPPSPFPP